MADVARAKESDQRFLLMGMSPSSLENPQKAPAAAPRTTLQASHRRTLDPQSWKARRVFPAWRPKNTVKMEVRQPSSPSGSNGTTVE